MSSTGNERLSELAPYFKSASKTDIGNADRFIYLHGADVRYVQVSARTGYWLYWTGTRWQRDSDAEAKRMARRLIEFIQEYANLLPFDEPEKAVWMTFSIKIQNGRKLADALGHAQYNDQINVKPDIFDTNPMLLNCQNGTLDLSGHVPVLREHRREDYITQIVPIPWLPDAKSERWEHALKFWLPDDAVRQFVQRFLGSAATGLVLDDYLLVFEGEGGTGKSTFINGVLSVLGDYGKTANPSVVMRRRVDQPSNDLMRLKGARLIAMLETEGGKSFDAETLKRVVAGDNEVARYLYNEYQEFKWTAKWLLGTNDPPQIRADDSGAWRRLVRIVFNQKVPDAIKDRSLRDDVRQDHDLQTAIFTWLIAGWTAWRADGLELPTTVRAATEAYRDDNRSMVDDWLGIVPRDPKGHSATGDLYAEFRRYCERQGEDKEHIISVRAFGRRLGREPDLTAVKLNNVTRGWRGIRLPTVDEQVIDTHGRDVRDVRNDLDA